MAERAVVKVVPRGQGGWVAGNAPVGLWVHLHLQVGSPC